MDDKDFDKLQQEVIQKCQEYWEAYASNYGKQGFVWLKHDVTNQFMVYTRGEYTKQIRDFLKTLD